MIVDLGFRHDTRCEKYCKRSDTTVKWLVLLSLEYHTPGKVSQPIRFDDQKELLIKCIYNSPIFYKATSNLSSEITQHLKLSLVPIWIHAVSTWEAS